MKTISNLLLSRLPLPTLLAASPVAALVVLLAASQSASANEALWTGVVNSSATTNWSDALNWQNIGTGGAGPTQNAATFSDATGVGASVINNVVDTTQNPYSLTYINTNSYQNTLIAPGQTLLVYTGGLLMGGTTFTNPGTPAMATISGAGGTLIVSNGNIAVQEAFPGTGNTPATLDLSGLDTFIGTNVSEMYIGYNNGSSSFARAAGILYLAKTNYLNLTGSTSPQINIGNNSQNNGPGSYLYLGQSNVISADNIGVGLTKQSSGGGGSIKFNSAFGNPVAVFRGHDGVSRVVTWAIGDGQAVGGTATVNGTCDFSGGTVDALVNAMWVGRNSTKNSGSGYVSTGTFDLGAGTFSVNNLTNAVISTNLLSASVTGTINVNAPGTLSVNTNFVMASTNALGSSAVTATATLNINGGNVQAYNLVAGGGNTTITMSGGSLAVTNVMGSPARPIVNFSISSAILQFAVSNLTANASVANLYINDNSSTVNVSSLPVISAYPTALPLISFSALDAGGTLNLGTLPGTFTGFISNDNSSMVWLVITNGPSAGKTDTWGGNLSDVWDNTTLNWTNAGVSVDYNEGDAVIFDDSAQISAVSLSVAHSPASWTVNNNSLNYTFSGAGSVVGPVALVKSGGASLTLSASGGDGMSGGIAVNGGTLVLDDANATNSGGLNIANGATAQIGNNDANGAVPAGSVTDNGSLIFDQTGTLNVTDPISGSGSLTQNGIGKITLSAANSYNGNTTVNAGTLAITVAGALSNSPNISVSSAALDVSAAGGLTLNNLNLANASLMVGVPYGQPGLTSVNFGTSGSGDTINVASLPPIAAYPTTVTLLSVPNGIGGNGYDFTLGSLPAAGTPYSGSISNSNNNAVVLVLSAGPIGTRPSTIWTGVDEQSSGNVSNDWSDAFNWQTPGAPAPGDNVIFNSNGSGGGSGLSTIGGGPAAFVPQYFNNVADANFTFSSLTYTNIGADQNTWITNGATVAITNAGGLTIGSGSLDFGSGATILTTIAGTNGTLELLNTNSTLYVGLGANSSSGSELATLDLSALGTFDVLASRILIGVGSESEGLNLPRVGGVVYLAATNIITATETNNSPISNDTISGTPVDIGDDDGNAGAVNYLYLGQTNAIFADAIGVGRQKASGNLLFNPVWTSPSAYFRGQDGLSPVAVWDAGDGIVNSGTATCGGTIDFTGGHLDALVDAAYFGRGASNATSSGTATGILTFDNGTFNANTIYAGYQSLSSSKVGIGIINVNTNAGLGTYGTLIVNGTLNLALTAGGAGAATTAGTLNLNGGTAQINNLTAGTNGTSTVNVNGGTLTITGNAGSPSAHLTAFNLTGGTLTLNVNGSSAVTNVVATTVSVNGTTVLQIGSISGAVAGVTYPLISYTGSDPYASLSLAPLPAGYTGSLVDGSATNLIGLSLTSVPVLTPPVITGISVQAGNLVINGTNGTTGNSYYVLETTNLALPFADWTPVSTNTFQANGSFSITNPVNGAVHQQFYILKLP